MTENEWQNCAEPHAMLEFLQTCGLVSNRKLRLFAVACSRRVWIWIDVLGRCAVEVAEKYSDGIAGPEELRAARLACQGAGGQAAWYAAATNAGIAARNAARSAQAGVANNGQSGSETAELLAQAVLVRDIFGPIPFRSWALDSSWLTPTVVELAQVIYDGKCFDRMPILADVLEKAGCNNEATLRHLRERGPHVRGCWAVDAVVGKG
jgi:hypothetical protein